MSEWKEISAQHTKEKMDAGDASVYDIRDPDSYNASHIPDAVHLNDSNVKDFIASSDKERPLIVYCYHGNSSRGAAGFFAEQGFKEVYSMAGGFESWVHNYPCEP